MDLLTTLIIALGLAMDVFAVSLGIATSGRANSSRAVFRVAWHTGLFQGLMTLLGWLAGSTIVNLIAGVDHWIALALLAFVGLRMVKEGLSKETEEVRTADPTRGALLMTIAVATSIDALAVGLSFAMLKVDILSASLIIGLASVAMSLLGSLLGSRLGQTFGKRMEVLGGLLLVGIGLRILFSHIL